MFPKRKTLMANRQYGLFPEEKRDLYVDQSPSGGGKVSSVYTPHGVRCIESEYTSLILNIGKKIKNVYKIDRRQIEYSCLGTRKVDTSYDFHTFYDKVNLGEKFYSDVRIVWGEGNYKDFFYISPSLVDNTEVDIQKLTKSIVQNPNLHVLIKENLLHNIQKR